jgi:hypothetical protein
LTLAWTAPTIENMAGEAGLLAHLWESTAERLRQRCRGLSDEEFFWEPVPDAWNIRRDPARPGRWTYEYEYDPPPPHPVTTIGWRLVHLAADNWIYWEHAFGEGTRNFPDLDVPHTAATALQGWSESRRPISRWLKASSGPDLHEPRPSHLGGTRTAEQVLGVLLDEQIHHGAEIALLRDLHLRLRLSPR